MDKLPVDVTHLGKMLFWGMGGSTAYGLSTPSSDLDYRGVYIAPTENYFRISSKPKSEYVTLDPADIHFDEIEKFLIMVCKGNHNAISTLFIDPVYIGHSKLYQELQRVIPHMVPRDEYYNCVKGLADKSRKKLESIHTGQAYPTKEQLAAINKDAMQAIRIVDSACKFITTKQMTVKVSDLDRDLLLSIKHGEVTPTRCLRILDGKLRTLAKSHEVSQLRSTPAIAKADQLLLRIRRNHEFYKADAPDW